MTACSGSHAVSLDVLETLIHFCGKRRFAQRGSRHESVAFAILLCRYVTLCENLGDTFLAPLAAHLPGHNAPNENQCARIMRFCADQFSDGYTRRRDGIPTFQDWFEGIERMALGATWGYYSELLILVAMLPRRYWVKCKWKDSTVCWIRGMIFAEREADLDLGRMGVLHALSKWCTSPTQRYLTYFYAFRIIQANPQHVYGYLVDNSTKRSLFDIAVSNKETSLVDLSALFAAIPRFYFDRNFSKIIFKSADHFNAVFDGLIGATPVTKISLVMSEMTAFARIERSERGFLLPPPPADDRMFMLKLTMRSPFLPNPERESLTNALNDLLDAWKQGSTPPVTESRDNHHEDEGPLADDALAGSGDASSATGDDISPTASKYCMKD